MKVVGVTFGVNSIACRVDSTGGVHFRSKCDCLKPGEEKNGDRFQRQKTIDVTSPRVGEKMLTVILPTLRLAFAVRGHPLSATGGGCGLWSDGTFSSRASSRKRKGSESYIIY